MTNENGPGDSDAAVLREIAAGNLARFDAFVDRHKGRLLTYLAYRLGDAHRAEDLLQEVFLRVFRAARGGASAGRGAAITWLITVANNCVIDEYRRRGRKPAILRSDLASDAEGDGPTEMIVDKTGDPADELQRRESLQRVRVLLARLPEEQREVLDYKVLGGLTFAEIAELTGAPIPTVKSRMRYGLEKVRNMLSKEVAP